MYTAHEAPGFILSTLNKITPEILTCQNLEIYIWQPSVLLFMLKDLLGWKIEITQRPKITPDALQNSVVDRMLIEIG